MAVSKVTFGANMLAIMRIGPTSYQLWLLDRFRRADKLALFPKYKVRTTHNKGGLEVKVVPPFFRTF
jgi:hypothetical protein